jgi:hypothetical protein
MNVVKLHLGKAIAVIALVFSIALPAVAQEVKIGVVNVPVFWRSKLNSRTSAKKFSVI